ncbi:MAG: ATP-dependent helicase HrpB [Microthrixaceae bacterium]
MSAPEPAALGALTGLRAALAGPGAAVLVAPPGTGKTTAIAPALLDEPWATGRLVVTEPRRLAARAAARYMAGRLGEPVGGTVGYSVRGERRTSAGTRVELVTEGLLLRRLQRDPSLEGVAAVLLDEVHERSTDLDLLLALLTDVRSSLRPDLRLVAMSATVDPGPIAELLAPPGGPPVPVAVTELPAHPVATRYRPGSAHDPLEDRTATVVAEALRTDPGDVLVFLPGRGEIRRTAAALGRAGLPAGVEVMQLHGSVPDRDQDEVLRPTGATRRVVLATSIAETSLTVPRIGVVVDAGRRRTVRTDPRTGLPGLVTGPVSRAGADQRRGRTGRTGPGVCYRLWSAEDERHRPTRDEPAILAEDLTGPVLQVRAWGAAVDELRWLDPPPPRAVAAADRLLSGLGALDPSGRLTPAGRELATLGAHPRLGAVVHATSDPDTAAALAAVLEADRPGPVDLEDRVRAVRSGRGDDAERRAEREWRTRLRGDPAGAGVPLGRAVLAGFPDRLARRRPGTRTVGRRELAVYHLVTGGEVALPADDPVARAEWIVVPSLDAGVRPARVHLVAAVDAADAIDPARIAVERTTAWDRDAGAVVARERHHLGAVTLEERPWADPDPDALRAPLAEGLAEVAAATAPAEDARTARREVARRGGADVPTAGHGDRPDLVDAALAAGARTSEDLAQVVRRGHGADALPWAARRALDELAPERLALPSGRTAALTYSWTDDPDGSRVPEVTLSVRLQDLLGLDEHPTVGRGTVPVTVELLSPAGRPVQRTRDLPGFWRGSYAAVRSDLRGRYPKHRWPERPWEE